MKSRMVAGYQKHKTLIWIMLAAAAVRLVFYAGMDFPDVAMAKSGDAGSYLFPNEVRQVLLPRVPVYPLFVELVRLFAGGDGVPAGTIILQSLLSYASIPLFYKVAEWLLKNSRVRAVTTLAYAILPAFLFYNRVIRVESLSITLFVVFLFVIVACIRQEKAWAGILAGGAALLLTLLRPSMVFLLPCLLLFWVLRLAEKRPAKQQLAGLLAAVVAGGAVLGYCGLNGARYGQFALTDVSGYNQFVICAQSPLYHGGEDEEIVERITAGEAPDDIYQSYPVQRTAAFVRSAYLNDLKGYLKYNLDKLAALLPTSVFTWGGYLSSEMWPLIKGNIWGTLSTLYMGLLSPFTFAFLLFLLAAFLVVLIRRWRREKAIPWVDAVLWACVFLQFATGFLGAQAEYARMMVAVMPVLLLWLGMVADAVTPALRAPQGG